VRNHVPVLQLAELITDGESVPDMSYHRQFRSRFTMKRELCTLRAHHEGNSSDTSISES